MEFKQQIGYKKEGEAILNRNFRIGKTLMQRFCINEIMGYIKN
jgi:hypothetical protein